MPTFYPRICSAPSVKPYSIWVVTVSQAFELPPPVGREDSYLAAILGVLSDIRDRLPEREVLVVDGASGSRVVELVEPAPPVEVPGQASLLEPEVASPHKRTRQRPARS